MVGQGVIHRNIPRSPDELDIDIMSIPGRKSRRAGYVCVIETNLSLKLE